MVKGFWKPHDHKNTTNRLLMIKLKGASKERVRGPQGANISDSPRGVTAPVSKSLASDDNIAENFGRGWGKILGPRRQLEKVEMGLLKS